MGCSTMLVFLLVFLNAQMRKKNKHVFLKLKSRKRNNLIEMDKQIDKNTPVQKKKLSIEQRNKTGHRRQRKYLSKRLQTWCKHPEFTKNCKD